MLFSYHFLGKLAETGQPPKNNGVTGLQLPDSCFPEDYP
jgi:hypothetical protein